MLTAMTEDDWAIVLQVFRAVRSRRGDKGRDDRKFLEALHYFTVHNITWRALSAEFGHWNSIWKRFWRLSRAGIFEAFFDALAALSESAHLVQMFELHGGARPRLGRGGKGGARRSGARPFAWRLLNQNPPQGRPRRLAARLPSDRGRSQRQPQLRTPARHRTRYFAARRHHRQRLRRQIQSRRRPQARHLSGLLPAVRIRAYSAEKLRLLCGGPSPLVVECSRVASPINAGLRPPPTAADGIDRGCHTAAICLQEVDGKVRSAYPPPNFMPENFAAPSLRGS